MKKLTFCILISALAGGSMAADFYCDAAADGGAHDGSIGDPFNEADLHDLAEEWSPGDTIFCKGAFGTITFSAQTYGIDANNPTIWKDWPTFTPDANRVEGSGDADLFLRLDGWKIDGGWSDTGGVTISAQADINDLQFYNCSRIFGRRRINPSSGDFYPYIGSDTSVTNRVVNGGAGGLNPARWVFDNCTIGNGANGLVVSGDGNGARNWIIRNNVITKMTRDSLVLSAGNGKNYSHLVQDNHFTDSNSWRAATWWQGVPHGGLDSGDWDDYQYQLMTQYNDSNEVVGSGFFWKIDDGKEPNAIWIFADDSDFLPVFTNFVGRWELDSDANAFFDWDMNDLSDIGHGDYVSLQGGGGSGKDWDDPTIIERNWFDDIAGGQFFIISVSSQTYVIIRNNVLIGRNVGSPYMFLISKGHINMYGNTVLDVDDSSSGCLFVSSGTDEFIGHGNIFTKVTAIGAVFDTNNNVFIDDEGDVDPEMRGPNDVYGQTMANLFADGPTDVNLVADSNAIDAGSLSHTDGVDFTNSARSGTPDAGAYEFFAPSESIVYSFLADASDWWRYYYLYKDCEVLK